MKDKQKPSSRLESPSLDVFVSRFQRLLHIRLTLKGHPQGRAEDLLLGARPKS